jgi:hypothetical protein
MNLYLRPSSVAYKTYTAMRKNSLFRDLVSEGAKLYPSLWKASGEINLTAMARLYKSKGVPVSQPTLLRLWDGEYDPSNETIEATYRVFGIPRELLRGEHVNDMNELTHGYELSTLLIAKKLSRLPKADFDALMVQIELAHERAEKLRELLNKSPNIVPIDKHKKT